MREKTTTGRFLISCLAALSVSVGSAGAATAPGTVIVNVATAEHSGGSGPLSGTITVTSNAVSTPVLAPASLLVTKSSDPSGTVPPATVVTFRLMVENPSSVGLTNAIIIDPIDPLLMDPTDVSDVSVPDGGAGGAPIPLTASYDVAGRTLRWTIPDIPAGARFELTFRSQIDPAAPEDSVIRNVTSQTSDQDPIGTGSNVVVLGVLSAPLKITKLANRSRVDVGGLVGYTVEVTNISPSLSLTSAEVTDRLPKGFSYLEKSTRIDGAKSDDPVRDGSSNRNLTFLLGDLAVGQTVRLGYVAIPTPIAEGHDGINRAEVRATTPSGTPVGAGPVEVRVRVDSSLVSGESVVMGRVFVDDNHNGLYDEGEVGVPMTRVYLEDGTFAITDVVGKYHIEAVRSGLHVLKTDASTMPEGLGAFASWSRSAGGGGTQFLDLGSDELFKSNVATGGWGISLARLDARGVYRTEGKEDRTVEFPPVLASAIFEPERDEMRETGKAVVEGYAGLIRERGGRLISLEVEPSFYPMADEPLMRRRAERLREDLSRLAMAQKTRTPGGAATADAAPEAVEQTVVTASSHRSSPETAALEERVKQMDPAPDLLLPVESEPLGTERTNVEAKLPAGLTPKLTVNGKEIPADRIAVRMETSLTKLVFYRYQGVAFREGRNSLVLEGIDQWGNARAWVERTIERVGPPRELVIQTAEGTRKADGRTPLGVRVQARDALGLPVADGTLVTMDVDHGTILGVDADPAQEGFQARTRDGAASIMLSPSDDDSPRVLTAKAGEAEAAQEISLAPEIRDWIVAGVGEASIGHRGDTSGADPSDLLEQSGGADGRVALFARGRIAGASLMTFAYDSGRERDPDQVFRQVAPDRFFPIYGDTGRQGYDVEGQSKLSLRLDQPRSSFTVGDFVTGLSSGDLLRYDRSLTGGTGRVDLHGFTLQSFGATTPQTQVRDDLPGAGISGPYRMTRRPVIVNSEQVRIETRDRFHEERVISSHQASRFADYDIDYTGGSVLFKRPVPFQDDDFNPVYIVIIYETLDGAGDEVVAGGRMGYRFGEAAEVGATYVDEARDGGDFILRGTDFRMRHGFSKGSLELSGEAAETEVASQDPSGAVSFRTAATIGGHVTLAGTYRNVASGFSNLSRTGLTDAGTVRWGFEGKAELPGKSSLATEFYSQQDSLGARDRRVASLDWEGHVGERVTARSGVKDLRAVTPDTGEPETSRLVSAGASVRLASRLDGQIARQQVVSGAALAEYPTRTSLGLNYRLTDETRGFLRQELDQFDGGNASRSVVGLESHLTRNTVMESRYSLEDALTGERGAAQMGIRTRLPLNRDWLGDAAVERVAATRGSSAGDFTSLGVGFEYLPARVKFTTRYEFRLGELDQRHVLTAAGATRVTDALSLFCRQRLFLVSPDVGSSRFDGDGLLGFAYRPVRVDRVNFLFKLQGQKGDGLIGTTSPQARSLLGVLEVNYQPAARVHLLNRLAMKRSEDAFDGASFSSLTRLSEMRALIDITDRWNAGASVRFLDQITTSSRLTGLGLEAGYRVVKDMMLVAGYNIAGFKAGGFGDGDLRDAGPFLSVRFKFDEETVLGLTHALAGKARSDQPEESQASPTGNR